jgi:tRNA(Ile)-lysidine synthase
LIDNPQSPIDNLDVSISLNTGLYRPGDRLGVAVSGGADSVALLRLLLEQRAELGVVLSVVHFNHKLRADESEADEAFVHNLAAAHQLELHSSEADTRRFAREKELSLEAAARDLRYAFFGRIIKEGSLNKIATAHTLDDQAETVLLRIFRGTGTSGLAGIQPQLNVGDGSIIRPLLQTRRADLRTYLENIQQPWREDSSNSDAAFTRNRLRHELLPLIEQSFNPDIATALSNLAEIARAEDELWARDTAEAFIRCYRDHRIDARHLAQLPLALQRRVVRLAAIQSGIALDFPHGERILKLAAENKRKTIELPNGFRAEIENGTLTFHTDQPQPKSCGFSYMLPLPGEISIPELQLRLCARLVTATDSSDGYNDDRRLALARLTPHLVIRNWRPGDRFWPAHSRSEKKVKELLQERHLPAREKSLWPVALADDQLVWMRGFPVSTRHAASHEPAIVIEEFPLSSNTN